MDANLLDLRRNTKKIVTALKNRERITLYNRGKPIGRIVPLEDRDDEKPIMEHPAFGMWKDMENEISVEEQIREMRKGRFDDL